jgi:hypothetical protein
MGDHKSGPEFGSRCRRSDILGRQIRACSLGSQISRIPSQPEPICSNLPYTHMAGNISFSYNLTRACLRADVETCPVSEVSHLGSDESTLHQEWSSPQAPVHRGNLCYGTLFFKLKQCLNNKFKHLSRLLQDWFSPSQSVDVLQTKTVF